MVGRFGASSMQPTESTMTNWLHHEGNNDDEMRRDKDYDEVKEPVNQDELCGRGHLCPC